MKDTEKKENLTVHVKKTKQKATTTKKKPTKQQNLVLWMLWVVSGSAEKSH